MTMRSAAYQLQELTSFVGRTAEIGELRELLRTNRAVTLCGAGGIGKTRLAAQLLSAVAADFPDGTWFVELGELRRPEQVVSWVAAAIGAREEPGRPLIDTLADALRHRHAILVLDNCEHLIQECAALCQRLLARAPGLQVIATSREPLRVAAETVWQVPPLALPPALPIPTVVADPPAAADPTPAAPEAAPTSESADAYSLYSFDAIRLFVARAAAVAPGFALGPANAADVAAICRALDGLPLAIELTAAWARVLSLGQIADRIDARLALLPSADRSAPARQQTLRATIDWSYGLLSGPEQILLRRLSVPAGWSLDMAEQVCADESLPAEQILDLLTALADKSLVEVGPEAMGQVRYRMLETVRTYAAGLLAEAGETSVMRRRMRDYTLREAERAADIGMGKANVPWPDILRAFLRVDIEAANLAEVLSRCLSERDVDGGLRLCTSLRTFWIVRGAFAGGAAWYDQFLAFASSSTPASLRGAALAGRAQLALASGSTDEAEDLAREGLELSSKAGESFWAATARNVLAEVALHANRPDEAVAMASETLAVARSAGDRWNEGYALATMATVAAIRGSLGEARRLGEDALAVMRSIDQQWGCARTMLGLGDLARLQGEPDTARAYYLESLAILRDLNDRPDMARCLAGLGRMAMEQADLGSARQHLAESLRLSYASGSRIGMARGLEAIARLSVLEGRPDVGVQLTGAVAALRAEAHLPPLSGTRTQRSLDAAAGLSAEAVGGLWAEGMGMTPSAAVRLALGDDNAAASGESAGQTDSHGTGLPEARAKPATPLTQRENEVVALLAAGLSNRDIASELSISLATAQRHVANILAKLDFNSRSQVAVWADGRPGD
jgi:predicted ATPase/DNA-binding NarL/FixJ family response regulator